MRKYQVTVVFNPESKIDEATSEIKELITSLGGTVEAEEDMSTKRLAFEIAGNTEGSFYNLRVAGPSELPARLSEALRINDQVIRFLVTHYSPEKTKLDPATEVRGK